MVDANDLDLVVRLFTEDCVVEYGRGFGADSHAGLRETMSGIPDFFAANHLISNIAVQFDTDDAARVRAVVHAWHRYADGRPVATWFGHYADTVVRSATGWRTGLCRVDHRVNRPSPAGEPADPVRPRFLTPSAVR